MNRLAVAGAVMAVCALHAPTLAQGSMTTPRGGLAKEGTSHSAAFGWYANARFQLFDNDHTGGGEATITEIAFRMDHHNHNTATATGRTWTRITLDISETANYDNVSLTWAQNITSTPTRVFANQWSWPTVLGSPALKPDAWGGAGGSLRFPFISPWRYTGKQAMLMDYVFQGGTLANQAPWPGEADYFFDGQGFEFVTQAEVSRLPESSTCNDSQLPILAPGAETVAWASLYSPYAPEVSLRNKIRIQHLSYGTAIDAPVVHVLGFSGLATSAGIDIGARCNRLYIDFTKPVAMVNLNTSGMAALSGQHSWVATWNNALANRDIYVQAAWSDSKTNSFSLTTATRLTLPEGPLTVQPRQNKVVVNPESDQLFAYRILPIAEAAFPCTRYKTQ